MTRPAQGRAELRRVALFLAAGVLNTAFGYGVYALCVAIGLLPSFAVVVSTVAGVCFNFRTLGAVFAGQGYSRLPRFVAVYAALMALNIVLIKLAGHAGIEPYLAGLLALLAVTPLTYIAMRLFVFAPAAVSNRLA